MKATGTAGDPHAHAQAAAQGRQTNDVVSVNRDRLIMSKITWSTGEAGAAGAEPSTGFVAVWLVVELPALCLTDRYAMLCAVSYRALMVAISAEYNLICSVGQLHVTWHVDGSMTYKDALHMARHTCSDHTTVVHKRQQISTWHAHMYECSMDRQTVLPKKVS